MGGRVGERAGAAAKMPLMGIFQPDPELFGSSFGPMHDVSANIAQWGACGRVGMTYESFSMPLVAICPMARGKD
jgi:hypothetical protein